MLLFSRKVVSNSFVTPWTIACQAPLSTGFPRQEYWSGLPFPSPGELPDAGIEPASPELAGGFFTTEPPGKPLDIMEDPYFLKKTTSFNANEIHSLEKNNSFMPKLLFTTYQ